MLNYYRDLGCRTGRLSASDLVVRAALLASPPARAVQWICGRSAATTLCQLFLPCGGLPPFPEPNASFKKRRCAAHGTPPKPA